MSYSFEGFYFAIGEMKKTEASVKVEASVFVF